MNRYVLDASALLALINKETGHEQVAEVVTFSVMSTVNMTESLTSLKKHGISIQEARLIITDLLGEVIPFDEDQAVAAAALVTQTQKLGLSLGDRACLGLGMNLRIPVLTADKIWLKLNVGVSIKSIR